MSALSVVRALGPIDAANVRRDPLLRWMFVLPLAFGLLFRWAFGLVDPWLSGFEPSLDPLIASSILGIAPMLYGVVVGFLLLDQKDDGTLTALQVTPLSARGYLAYRIAIPVAISVAVTPLALGLGGFTRIGVGAQLLAGLVAAPLAPMFAFFLVAVAKNKVQGFALMKAAGVINWPPIIAWFVSSDWQWAFGIAPTYWPLKVYWELEAGSPDWWIYAAVGYAYTGLIIWLLARRFRKRLTT